MEGVPNDLRTTWEDWNRVGMALYATDNSSFGFELFDLWSQRRKDKYDPENTEAKWAAYATSPPNNIGVGTLFFLANCAQFEGEAEAIAILQAQGEWDRTSAEEAFPDDLEDDENADDQAKQHDPLGGGGPDELRSLDPVHLDEPPGKANADRNRDHSPDEILSIVGQVRAVSFDVSDAVEDRLEMTGLHSHLAQIIACQSELRQLRLVVGYRGLVKLARVIGRFRVKTYPAKPGFQRHGEPHRQKRDLRPRRHTFAEVV